jgi:hypothetical protein
MSSEMVPVNVLSAAVRASAPRRRQKAALRNMLFIVSIFAVGPFEKYGDERHYDDRGSMHEYDIALKVLLQASTDSLMRQVTGVSVARWLNVEMPEVLSSRVDLLGETADHTLVHIELQSTNDPHMALRMAEYSLRIYRQFRKFPKQVVLYVGERKLHMNSRLSGPDSAFQYTLVDVRELDGAVLLASKRVEDSFLAVLTRLEDRTSGIRQILARIASLQKPARRDALAQFLIISGIRALEETVKGRRRRCPY